MSMKILLVSITGGLLCLDRVFLQTMLSRPIVAAPLTGSLLGDPLTGLIAGAFCELFWIDRLPIGGYILPNDTLAAVLMTACAIESGRLLGGTSQGLIALAVLLFVPFAEVGRLLDRWLIERNGRLADDAQRSAAGGDAGAVVRGHRRAVLRAWLYPTALILIAFPSGVALLAWGYPRLADPVTRGLGLLYGLLPLIGAAVVLNAVQLTRALPLLCAAFLLATAALRLLSGP